MCCMKPPLRYLFSGTTLPSYQFLSHLATLPSNWYQISQKHRTHPLNTITPNSNHHKRTHLRKVSSIFVNTTQSINMCVAQSKFKKMSHHFKNVSYLGYLLLWLGIQYGTQEYLLSVLSILLVKNHVTSCGYHCKKTNDKKRRGWFSNELRERGYRITTTKIPS